MPFAERQMKTGLMTEGVVIHPSPKNAVELFDGMLRKRYDCVGAASGRKTGESVTVQFSESAGYSVLMPERSIYRGDDGIALGWFKRDVASAAAMDKRVREFVVSHPGMRVSV